MAAKIGFLSKLVLLIALIFALKNSFDFICFALENETASPERFGSVLLWVASAFAGLLVWSMLLISMNGARGREEA
jgi:NO-binding membrane sensor protein with MHYT domain